MEGLGWVHRRVCPRQWQSKRSGFRNPTGSPAAIRPLQSLQYLATLVFAFAWWLADVECISDCISTALPRNRKRSD